MLISEILLERNRQRSRKYYHGTTTNYLNSIKKFGLLPDTGNVSFGDKGLQSLGGVYATPYKQYATIAAKEVAKKHGGDPLLITILYVSKSGTIDEDLVRDIIVFYVMRAMNDKSYGDSKDKIISELKNVLELRMPNVKITDNSLEILRELVELIYNLEKKRREIGSREPIVYRPEFRQWLTKFVNSLRAGHLNMKQNRYTVRGQIKGSVRITRPVTFKGKTRIIEIKNLNTGEIYYNRN